MAVALGRSFNCMLQNCHQELLLVVRGGELLPVCHSNGATAPTKVSQQPLLGHDGTSHLISNIHIDCNLAHIEHDNGKSVVVHACLQEHKAAMSPQQLGSVNLLCDYRRYVAQYVAQDTRVLRASPELGGCLRELPHPLLPARHPAHMHCLAAALTSSKLPRCHSLQLISWLEQSLHWARCCCRLYLVVHHCHCCCSCHRCRCWPHGTG